VLAERFTRARPSETSCRHMSDRTGVTHP
jgi:hypothetical protein